MKFISLILVPSALAIWPFTGKSAQERVQETGTKVSRDMPDMFRSFYNSLSAMNTHSPRIVRTPTSLNYLFDAPGFDVSDLKISHDESNVYLKGKTFCPEGSHVEKTWSGEELANDDKGLCIERSLNAHLNLPKGTHENGRIQAVLENGVLRVRVPLQREASLGQRIVEVFTGPYHAMKNTGNKAYEAGRDMYSNVEDTVYESGRAAQHAAGKAKDYVYGSGKAAQDAAGRAKDTAQDYGRAAYDKAAQMGEEYVAKPVRGAQEYASDESGRVYDQAQKAKGGLYEKIMHPFGGNEAKGNVPVREGKIADL